MIKSTFLAGLIAAIAVVATDFLNAFVLHPEQGFNYLALLIAVGIGVVGYAGRYLSGQTNTVVAMIGSALLAIVPMLSGSVIDWKLVGAVFLLKLLGLFTSVASSTASQNNSKYPPYNSGI